VILKKQAIELVNVGLGEYSGAERKADKSENLGAGISCAKMICTISTYNWL
jgi:hypothetical protein